MPLAIDYACICVFVYGWSVAILQSDTYDLHTCTYMPAPPLSFRSVCSVCDWNQEGIFYIFILNQAVKTYKIVDFIGDKNTNKLALKPSLLLFLITLFISRLDMPSPPIFIIKTKNKNLHIIYFSLSSMNPCLQYLQHSNPERSLFFILLVAFS